MSKRVTEKEAYTFLKYAISDGTQIKLTDPNINWFSGESYVSFDMKLHRVVIYNNGGSIGYLFSMERLIGPDAGAKGDKKQWRVDPISILSEYELIKLEELLKKAI